MSLTRPVAILLATVTLLSAAGVACAASPKLTLTPPAALSPGPVTPKPVRPSIPATGAPTTSAGPVGAIPRTGIDLPLELLLALLLIVTGAMLRPRRPAGRA